MKNAITLMLLIMVMLTSTSGICNDEDETERLTTEEELTMLIIQCRQDGIDAGFEGDELTILIAECVGLSDKLVEDNEDSEYKEDDTETGDDIPSGTTENPVYECRIPSVPHAKLISC